MDGEWDTTKTELEALRARVARLEGLVAEVRGDRAAAALPEDGGVKPPPPPRVPEPLVQHGREIEVPSVRSAAWGGVFPGTGAGLAAPAEAVGVPSGPRSLEERLGSEVFNAVGIFALIFGMAYFLKLAMEHGWIGPAGRVLAGLAAGAGLVAWSEVFRRRKMAAFSFSLKAVGSGVLYLSVWAAYQLYSLMPAGLALGAMVLVTAGNAFLAWKQDAEPLAGYALLGGFLTPLLLSTGGDHETFLFTYLAALDVGAVLLIRWKPWRWLAGAGLLGTALYFIGWYSSFFHTGWSGGWGAQSWETALFSILFLWVFALVTLRGWPVYPEGEAAVREQKLPMMVVLPLANAVFVGQALYSVFQDSGLHDSLAWLMIGIAAVLFGLMRVQATEVAAAVQLAAGVAFVTIAIALKFNGHTLTSAWQVEGLVLYWASTRTRDLSAGVLRVFSAVGSGLGLASLAVHLWWFGGVGEGFLNAGLAAALLGVATLAGTVWLAEQQTLEGRRAKFAGLAGLDGIGFLLVAREVWSTWSGETHAAFATADFGRAVVGLAVLAGATWWGYRRREEVFSAWSSIVFHLLVILTVEREIGALWTRSEANVQRSLAISGFLMAYGAGLLGAGFWRRNAFVRWQGLVLLIFTICKVFLYDTSSLSAGYRVASLMGLGAVLMGVSYAYQKDWLGLKQHPDVRLGEGRG